MPQKYHNNEQRGGNICVCKLKIPEIGEQGESCLLIARDCGQRQRLPRCARNKATPHEREHHPKREKIIPESLQGTLSAATCDWMFWQGGWRQRGRGGDGGASGREIRMVPVVRHRAMERLVWSENWRVIQEATRG